MSTQAANAPLSVSGSPTTLVRRMVALLAIGGAVVVSVQLWGFAAWLLTGPLEPIRSAGPVPSQITRSVRIAELTSLIGASCWFGFVAFGWRRRQALTWPLLWTIAWACVFWQEPLVNVRTHTFSFNHEFHNLGDWTTHLPFVPNSYSPLPEALVLEGLVFVYLLPLMAIAVAAYLRFLQRTFGLRRVVPLILIAYLSVVAFDAVLELQGIHQGLLRYNVVGGPAINPGQTDQWPLFEGLTIAAAWVFPGVLTFLLRDHWKVQDSVPRWWQGRQATPMTVLAAIGALNVVFGAYNAAYVAVVDGTVAHQPAWLAPASAPPFSASPR